MRMINKNKIRQELISYFYNFGSARGYLDYNEVAEMIDTILKEEDYVGKDTFHRVEIDYNRIFKVPVQQVQEYLNRLLKKYGEGHLSYNWEDIFYNYEASENEDDIYSRLKEYVNHKAVSYIDFKRKEKGKKKRIEELEKELLELKKEIHE